MPDETTACRGDAPARPLAADARAWLRHRVELRVFCDPILPEAAEEPEGGWPARLCDISSGGIGLVLGRQFAPGTILVVELPTACLLAQVVYVTPEDDGPWHMGCQFARPVGDEQLELILGRARGLTTAAAAAADALH